MIYFIHNVLTDMFRPVFRPSSGRYYYKNAKGTNVVNHLMITTTSKPQGLHITYTLDSDSPYYIKHHSA